MKLSTCPFCGEPIKIQSSAGGKWYCVTHNCKKFMLELATVKTDAEAVESWHEFLEALSLT